MKLQEIRRPEIHKDHEKMEGKAGDGHTRNQFIAHDIIP
jgi:hypothetical protein